jgi:hypothetical protein
LAGQNIEGFMLQQFNHTKYSSKQIKSAYVALVDRGLGFEVDGKYVTEVKGFGEPMFNDNDLVLYQSESAMTIVGDWNGLWAVNVIDHILDSY